MWSMKCTAVRTVRVMMQCSNNRKVVDLHHIRRWFVDAIIENEPESMRFEDELKRKFATERYCAMMNLT